MALGKYNRRTVMADTGAVIAGATVSFFHQLTGLPATAYSDPDGMDPLGSSIESGDDGEVEVFLTPGKYRITTELGSYSDEITYEPVVGDLAVIDASEVALGFFELEVPAEASYIRTLANGFSELRTYSQVISDLGFSASTGAALVNTMDGGLQTVLDLVNTAPRGTSGIRYKFIAGVARKSGGTWAFINDTEHAPTNLTGISVNGDGTLRINHTPGALKVSTLLVVADDTYAKFGVLGGGSVGTSFSNITFAAPMCYILNMATGAVTAPEIWGTRITAVPGTSSCVVTHPARQTNMISAVSPVGSTAQQYDVSISDGTTSSTLYTVGNQGGYVYYDGTNWQYVGDMVNTPVITWDAVNYKLTLTHTTSADTYSVSIVGRDTPVQVRAGDISGTIIEVYFYSAAGIKLTVPDTDCKFFYDRRAKVRLNTVRGLVGVSAGMATVNANDLTNASGNFWIFGVMEV